MARIKNQSGLTLIELLIALAVSSILMLGMMMMLEGQSRNYNGQQAIVSMQEDMWASLQLMAREIRMAAYNPTLVSGASKPKIITATATDFDATQDSVIENGAIDDGEEIEYTYSAATKQIIRTTYTVAGHVPSAQPVMDNVTNMSFEYQTLTASAGVPWSWTWTLTPTDLTAIRTVKICIQARTNRPSKIGKHLNYDNVPTIESLPSAPDWSPTGTELKYPHRIMCTQIDLRNMLD